MKKTIAVFIAAMALVFGTYGVAVADQENGGTFNGYWVNALYQPWPAGMGEAKTKIEWHMDHFADGDALIEGFVETGWLNTGTCVQTAVDFRQSEGSTTHTDVHILRNCDPNSTASWSRRIDSDWVGPFNPEEFVWRMQTSLITSASDDNKATYHAQCRYMPGFAIATQACDDWDPWGPLNNANTRKTRWPSGDFTLNDGGNFYSPHV